MAGYILMGTLAAFGGLCMLWIFLGWLLPAGQGFAVVCCGRPDALQLLRFRWLRDLGLLKCPVVVLTGDDKIQWMNLEKCNEEELLLRLKQEYVRYYGTGTGDSAGRCQRCGIPEL